MAAAPSTDVSSPLRGGLFGALLFHGFAAIRFTRGYIPWPLRGRENLARFASGAVGALAWCKK